MWWFWISKNIRKPPQHKTDLFTLVLQSRQTKTIHFTNTFYMFSLKDTQTQTENVTLFLRANQFTLKSAYLSVSLPLLHDTKPLHSQSNKISRELMSQRSVTHDTLIWHSQLLPLTFHPAALLYENTVSFKFNYTQLDLHSPYPVITLSGSTHSSQSSIHTPQRVDSNLPPADWL